jgi:hypothetical protein
MQGSLLGDQSRAAISFGASSRFDGLFIQHLNILSSIGPRTADRGPRHQRADALHVTPTLLTWLARVARHRSRMCATKKGPVDMTGPTMSHSGHARDLYDLLREQLIAAGRDAAGSVRGICDAMGNRLDQLEVNLDEEARTSALH